jgi:hypothetical protein
VLFLKTKLNKFSIIICKIPITYCNGEGKAVVSRQSLLKRMSFASSSDVVALIFTSSNDVFASSNDVLLDSLLLPVCCEYYLLFQCPHLFSFQLTVSKFMPVLLKKNTID